MRLLIVIAVSFLGCAGGGVQPYFPDAGGTEPLPDSVGKTGAGFVNGAYEWRILSEPQFGGGLTTVLANSTTDVWFLGRDIRHWDGANFRRWPLVAAGLPDGAHYAETAVIRARNDIWIAGSALWHFDGEIWTDISTEFPGIQNPATGYNRFEIAGDANALFATEYALGTFFKMNEGGFTSINPGFNVDGRFAPRPGLFVQDGKLGAIYSGLFDDSTSTLAPGLKNSGLMWGRSGTQFYSYTHGDELTAFHVTTATAGSDFVSSGAVAISSMPWLGARPGVHVGPPQVEGTEGMEVTAIAASPARTTWLMRTSDGPGRFSFLVEQEGGAVTVTPDRLHGWEVFGAAAVDNTLFVVASSGAILQGTRR